MSKQRRTAEDFYNRVQAEYSGDMTRHEFHQFRSSFWGSASSLYEDLQYSFRSFYYVQRREGFSSKDNSVLSEFRRFIIETFNIVASRNGGLNAELIVSPFTYRSRKEDDAHECLIIINVLTKTLYLYDTALSRVDAGSSYTADIPQKLSTIYKELDGQSINGYTVSCPALTHTDPLQPYFEKEGVINGTCAFAAFIVVHAMLYMHVLNPTDASNQLVAMLKQKTALERHSFFAKYVRWVKSSKWRRMGANNANLDPENYFGRVRDIALAHNGDPRKGYYNLNNNRSKIGPYSNVLSKAVANEYEEIDRLYRRLQQLLGRHFSQKIPKPQQVINYDKKKNNNKNDNPLGFTPEQLETRREVRRAKRRFENW